MVALPTAQRKLDYGSRRHKKLRILWVTTVDLWCKRQHLLQCSAISQMHIFSFCQGNWSK